MASDPRTWHPAVAPMALTLGSLLDLEVKGMIFVCEIIGDDGAGNFTLRSLGLKDMVEAETQPCL